MDAVKEEDGEVNRDDLLWWPLNGADEKRRRRNDLKSIIWWVFFYVSLNVTFLQIYAKQQKQMIYSGNV